jgi:hypothetical protein
MVGLFLYSRVKPGRTNRPGLSHFSVSPGSTVPVVLENPKLSDIETFEEERIGSWLVEAGS